MSESDLPEEKPIRWAAKPVPAMRSKCDRCCASTTDDMRSGFRYEDTERRGFIERQEVERLCGNCMTSHHTRKAGHPMSESDDRAAAELTHP